MAKKSTGREVEDFVFEIEKAHFLYVLNATLSVNRFSPELQSLDLKARCLAPKRFRDRKVSVHLLGSEDASSSDARGSAPSRESVGVVQLGRSRAEVLASLPLERFHTYLPLILGEHIRFVLLRGPRLFRGKSICFSLHLASHVDPEDYLI